MTTSSKNNSRSDDDNILHDVNNIIAIDQMNDNSPTKSIKSTAVTEPNAQPIDGNHNKRHQEGRVSLMNKVQDQVSQVYQKVWLSSTYIQQMKQTIHDNPSKAFFIISLCTILVPFSTILSFIVKQVYHLLMTIIGTTIGIGFGLGFAIHIYELLDEAAYNYRNMKSIDQNDQSEQGIGIENHGQNQKIIKTCSSSFYTSASSTSNTNTNASAFQFIQNPYYIKNNNHKLHNLMHNQNAEAFHHQQQLSAISNNDAMDTSSAAIAASSYHTLMTNAGYAIPKNHLLRGQILRNVPMSNSSTKANDINGSNTTADAGCYVYCEDDIAKRKSLYSFPQPTKESSVSESNDKKNDNDDDNSSHTNHHNVNSKGKSTFARMWPNLPNKVQSELGTVVDYVLRDYVTSWYSYVDSGVQYEDATIQKERMEKEEEKAHSQQQNDNDGSGKFDTEEKEEEEEVKKMTTMVLSTAAIRSIPFLEILYTSLSAVLGNLSTFISDNVNVPELVLLKLVHILKVNIRTYQSIRKTVLKKEGSNHRQNPRRSSMDTASNSEYVDTNIPKVTEGHSKLGSVSEISIVKEYLIQGKLHRAITFGMDVPGLLFGDMKGEECPPPDCYQDDNSSSRGIHTNDHENVLLSDEILQRRLFGRNSRILYECELDYNRVLSHRIARILFQRADFNSPVLRSAVVEMLASCVITPMMGCTSPDYANMLIITSMEDASVTQMETNGLKIKVDADLDDDAREQHAMEMFEDDDDIDDDDESFHPSDVDSLDHSDDDGSLEDEDLNDDYIDEQIDMTPTKSSRASNYQKTNMIASPTDSVGVESTGTADVSYMDPSAEILALLSMALIETGAYVDFDEARAAKQNGRELEVSWNDMGCKEVIRNLVLVIESVLIHGMLQNRRKKNVIGEGDNQSIKTLDCIPSFEYTSMINLLMEVTSDLETFENKTKTTFIDEANEFDAQTFEEVLIGIEQVPKPNMTDLATLRTLISAWLHTGLAYRTLSVLAHSNYLLRPFYHEDAFILESDNLSVLLRKLQPLHEVELIVDTATVLSCQPLDLFQVDSLNNAGGSFFPPSLAEGSNEIQSVGETNTKTKMRLTKGLTTTRMPQLGLGRAIKANFDNNKKIISSLVRVGNNIDKSIRSHAQLPLSDGSPQKRSVPVHLNFHRNEVFASSLRNERDRRMKSFLQVFETPRTTVEMICRSRVNSEQHFQQHRDLHNLAKSIYFNTNALLLRSDSRRNNVDTQDEAKSIESTIVLETVASRRKMNIPEDDSSFLLRAQTNQLNVVSIHRDQNNSNLSYKKYAGYYDEPILHASTLEDRGGRLRRKCFVRYYPSDRTASITFIQVDRRLDYRSKKNVQSCISQECIDYRDRPKEFDRRPCYKFTKKGTERSVSTLSNSFMDSGDFSNVPRSGKAIDFLYRISLFEEPSIDFLGKRIIVQDANTIGCHQADASSLELSDASLSTALILDTSDGENQFYVKCDANNVPLLFIKVAENSQKMSSEKSNESLYKSFRTSFVRAALLVTSSREEAKLSCLQSCMRTGSAKRATKAKMDSLLQMPLFLLEYATSKTREKQSILLRDLKLGINHVDKDQLRRNGIYNPRYPTILKQLKVKVEDAVEMKGVNPNEILGQSTVLYKIRCIAITEYIGVHPDDSIDVKEDGSSPEYGDLFHEEWVVWREFRDVAQLHKMLKSIVNPSESSAGTGAKLVGAATGLATAATGLATAALTIGHSNFPGTSGLSSRKRKPFVPSLNQAAKAGALGTTRKSIEIRKQVLNGYFRHVLALNNPLSGCPELLRFLCAYEPLPPEIKLDHGVIPDYADALGRSEMKKSLLQSASTNQTFLKQIQMSPSNEIPLKTSESPKKDRTVNNKNEVDPTKLAILDSVRKRMERVKLSRVRASIFDLMRYTFDLDNASFFRNRMVSALKTMSFAFTSSHGFQKTLLNFHLKYLTGDSIAYYIKYLRDLMWPGGVIFTSAPPLSLQEQEELRMKSSKLLHEAFPDQLSALLGQENTDIGIDILHEMLQNRVVLRSMSYMMMDAIWLEIFPEIGDILSCSSTLDHVED